MTIVSNESRDSMKKILEALNGNKQSLKETSVYGNDSYNDDLMGPGQVSQKAVNAMANILSKLNNVTNQVVTESKFNSQLDEAIHTKRTNSGVTIGNYEILINEDKSRIAGKQFYSIYNTKSGDVIADDITLYEVALNTVKYLNKGKFVNSSIIRNLFDADERYSSNRTDAIRFKRRAKLAENSGDYNKSEIFESRFQASVLAANIAKKDIKRFIIESRQKKK